MEGFEEERLAFAEELEEVVLQLSLPAETGTDAEPAAALERVRDEYERLELAAEMFGLLPLKTLLQWAAASLNKSQAADLLAQGKYFSWLEVTALILREPQEKGHLPLLVTELCDPLWPEPLDQAQLQAFLLSLRPEQDEVSMGNTAASASAVTEAEASGQSAALGFAADVHPELLAAYQQETPALVSEAACLIRLLAAGSADPEQCRQATRLVHTLKGSSSVVGVEPLADFTHLLEDLLALPLQPVPAELQQTLEAAADCLESLFDQLQSGAGLPDEYPALKAELQSWHRRLTAQAQPAQTDNTDSTAVRSSLAALTELPEFLQQAGIQTDAGQGSRASQDASAAPAAAGLSESRIQGLLHLTGELITSTGRTAEQLQQARRLSARLYQQDEQVRLRLDELEIRLEQYKRRQQAQQFKSRRSEQDQNPVELEMEIYNELEGTASLLTEAVTDSREMAYELQNSIRYLSDELYQQQQIQRRLSEVVLGLRLVPVASLVPRLERIVRETCRRTGKQASLQVEGQSLQVDSDILKGLTDPLLHLLRNAVDHGIETAELRRQRQKPDSGQVSLSFTQTGHSIQLVLQDDGAGMQPARIRERAEQRGLISPDQALSEEALLRLVLLPGFSTRDEVSEVSGRGVGMDVVKAAIENLRGTLQLASVPGQGTTVTITLPQTLIATHALIVRAGGNLLAVPANHVEQLLYVSAEESQLDEQGWRIETERYQLPVMRLSDVLHWPGVPVDRRQSQTLLIVRGEQQHYAFYVEEVLPSRDIVINSLAPWLHFIPGVQGACILANGVVAPVLDMVRLLDVLENGTLIPQAGPEEAVDAPATVSRVILVVDDSLSNRKSMRLLLEGMGYTVHTAVDGVDALKLMNEVAVDLVVSDLEMPQMNGLELTQAIRIWPEMKHLPVVMATSRGTQKYRALAQEAGVDGYLTKPVQAELLAQELEKWLGTALRVNEE